MIKRVLREFYLLPRGEQRALILLSLLLILSLLFRITVQLLPVREPAGMEEFEQEARMIMATFARADTLQRVRSDSIRPIRAKLEILLIPLISTGPIRYNCFPFPGSDRSMQGVLLNTGICWEDLSGWTSCWRFMVYRKRPWV